MKYRFIEGFSLSGVHYAEGTVVDLDPDTVAALPEGVAEPEIEIEAEAPQLPPPPPTPPPPKGSKAT